MDSIKFAILGPGSIAEKMAWTVTQMPKVDGVELIPYAVASRSLERAEEFSKKFGFYKAYGSYEEMLIDPEIDLVYIATPHSHHYKHSMMCLQHGKHVLCEKAFTVNSAQAENVIGYAQEQGLLIAEAIWTRYLPVSGMINNILDSGIIGKPVLLSANLGYLVSHKERLTSPELAGGSLLDIGVYPLNFASMVFGDKITSWSSSCTLFDTGVDSSGSITLCFEGGKMAVLYFSAEAQTDRKGIIYGNKGTMVVENINNPEEIRIFDLNREKVAYYAAPKQITGFEYQVESAVRAIIEGRIECPEMPHAEIIRIMRLMDGFRAKWGVVYPSWD